MLMSIKSWENAPVWDVEGINKATETWFKFLGEK